MDTDNSISSSAPSHLLTSLNTSKNNGIGSYHGTDDLTVTTVHVSLTLTGDISIGGQGKDGHAWSVLGDHAG